MGAVVLGGDANLSADTYSVGSVIEKEDLKATGTGSAVKKPVHEGFDVAAGPGAPAASSTPSGKQRRVKAAGMVAYSQHPLAHPTVQPLLAAFGHASASVDSTGADGAGSGSDAESGRKSATASAAAQANIRFIRGVSTHPLRGGDNPFPNAVVMAYVPPAAPAVASAFAAAVAAAAPPSAPAVPAQGASTGAASASAGPYPAPAASAPAPGDDVKPMLNA